MLFVARTEDVSMVCNDPAVWQWVGAICPLYFLDITQDISGPGQEVRTLHHNIITRTRHIDPPDPKGTRACKASTNKLPPSSGNCESLTNLYRGYDHVNVSDSPKKP